MQAISLIKRAFRALGVVAEANEPSADMVSDGLNACAAMLAGWELRGVRIGAPFPLETSTVLPLAAREIETAVWSLAASLAPEYGRDGARFAAYAERGFRGMQAERMQPRVVATEWALYQRGAPAAWCPGGISSPTTPLPPPPSEPILTETGDPLLTEASEQITTE